MCTGKQHRPLEPHSLEGELDMRAVNYTVPCGAVGLTGGAGAGHGCKANPGFLGEPEPGAGLERPHRGEVVGAVFGGGVGNSEGQLSDLFLNLLFFCQPALERN